MILMIYYVNLFFKYIYIYKYQREMLNQNSKRIFHQMRKILVLLSRREMDFYQGVSNIQARQTCNFLGLNFNKDLYKSIEQIKFTLLITFFFYCPHTLLVRCARVHGIKPIKWYWICPEILHHVTIYHDIARSKGWCQCSELFRTYIQNSQLL